MAVSPIDIQVELAKVEAGMKRFAKEAGVSLKMVYEDVMRLASNSLVKNFYAKSLKVQRERIRKDLTNTVFVSTGKSGIKAIKQWVGVGEGAPPTVFRTSKGALLGVERKLLNLSGSIPTMKRHHENSRLKNGRTSKAGSYTRDIGRWKYIDKMVVPESALKKYIKFVQAKSGILKSGWMAPASAPFETKATGWVNRHKGNAKYNDQMDLFAQGFLQLTNEVPWSGEHDRLVKIELQKRQRDLNKFARKRLDKVVAQWNRGHANG